MDSADGLDLEGECKENITCARQSAMVICVSARCIGRPDGWSKTEPN